MPEIQVKNGIEDIEFFGDADKTIDRETGEKHVGSEYPCWYFDQQRQEVKDQIRRAEFALENGEIPSQGLAAHKAELKKLRKMDERIESSTPQFTDGHKDEMAKISKDLGKRIADLMFSRSDEMKGVADGHEEYRRQFTPCITLTGTELIIAKKLNCRIEGNKVSRNDATKVWKVLRKGIGENPDAEVLRKG